MQAAEATENPALAAVRSLLVNFNRGQEGVADVLAGFASGAYVYDGVAMQDFPGGVQSFLEFLGVTFVNPRVVVDSIKLEEQEGGLIVARFTGRADGVRAPYGDIQPTDQSTDVLYLGYYRLNGDNKVVSVELYSQSAA